jgi:uncharacterized membrane protein
LEGEFAMTQMFTIPPNTILVFGVAIVVAVIGFVIYGCIKGWKNVLPDYRGKKDKLTIDG